MIKKKIDLEMEAEEKDYLTEFYQKYPNTHLNRSTRKPMTYKEFQEMDALMQRMINEDIGGDVD